MAVVFLIGGTGNQAIQFAASRREDRFSSIFLNPFVRRLLGWVNHEAVFDFPRPSTLRLTASLSLLVFDLALSKVTGWTLFTEFDLRHLRGLPSVRRLTSVGYFQDRPSMRGWEELREQLVIPNVEVGVAVHVRGGDLLEIEARGLNSYGLLSPGYYSAALVSATAGRVDGDICVHTDDSAYAKKLFADISDKRRVEVVSDSLKSTLLDCVGARCFISSNSTLSYCIVHLRKGFGCVVPRPFQKAKEFEIPSRAERIEVEW